jgi:hypothetical protein
MKIFLLVITLISHTTLLAQDTKLVTVKAGVSIREYLSFADVFYYPRFINGIVYFKDGGRGSAKLNYNLLLDEINFIDAKNDTLVLANDTKETIDLISIDKDSFYFDNGYVMHIAGNNAVKLAVRQVWTKAAKERASVYNSNSLASSTVSLASYFVLGQGYNLISNEDVELRKVTHYYFGDKHNRFVLAGKKNLMKVFPDEEDRIEKYLKENKVDFSNQDHLKKVVNFLSQL